MSNSNLSKAQVNKNDEFYTQYEDIEKEVKHYEGYLKGKKVYLNCDDPTFSNFHKFFVDNFDRLGISSLTTTHICHEGVAHTVVISKSDCRFITYLKGDGDFRSEECLELMKECDVVITNPPFSLFREFINLVTDLGKDFLIVGNMNAISYKEVAPHILNGDIWLGVTCPRRYHLPDGSLSKPFGNHCWFTNIKHGSQNKPITLELTLDSMDYLEYDYYQAINVNKVKEIPKDYKGVMGVPLSYLQKHNPDQFELVNANDVKKDPNFKSSPHGLVKSQYADINGKQVYARILIKAK